MANKINKISNLIKKWLKINLRHHNLPEGIILDNKTNKQTKIINHMKE